MNRINGRSRIIGILVVAAALATGAYAFTATNTVPASSAGSGSGTISGYTVSNVAYQLNATTPSDIDSVTFTLSAAATHGEGKDRQRRYDVHQLLDRRWRQRHLQLRARTSTSRPPTSCR